jgi:light-regulated signal transduction histidine kinase (bacteriophytochrome)
LDEASRRFEAQLLGQLLTYEQESYTRAYRLNSLATERITDAQRQVSIVILAGLALIAAIIVGTSWFLRRNVLAPIAALRQATREVAAGNWDFVLGQRGDDEIGELSKNFDAMTKSLRESFAQVERSNQGLAALNEELKAFSYSVSHDLRGPLRSMDGFSLALLEDYGDKLDAEGRDALERIRGASQRMGGLIDDLLRLSQVTRAELNVTRVDLSAIAHEIAAGIVSEQPGRTVEWAIQPGLSVRADAPLMRIVMQNLLQNAWKFTGKTDQPVIRVGALEREGKMSYFVADNGVGFDMAHAQSLFGAFQRLHHAGDFPGTGIGLAIVQRIIRRHDGTVWAEAKEGEGATFFFSVKEAERGSDEQNHPAG